MRERRWRTFSTACKAFVAGSPQEGQKAGREEDRVGPDQEQIGVRQGRCWGNINLNWFQRPLSPSWPHLVLRLRSAQVSPRLLARTPPWPWNLKAMPADWIESIRI